MKRFGSAFLEVVRTHEGESASLSRPMEASRGEDPHNFDVVVLVDRVVVVRGTGDIPLDLTRLSDRRHSQLERTGLGSSRRWWPRSYEPRTSPTTNGPTASRSLPDAIAPKLARENGTGSLLDGPGRFPSRSDPTLAFCDKLASGRLRCTTGFSPASKACPAGSGPEYRRADERCRPPAPRVRGFRTLMPEPWPLVLASRADLSC